MIGNLDPRGERALVTDGLDGESRAAVAAVRELRRAGYSPTVTMSGRHSLAAASRDCRRRLHVPRADRDPAGFRAAIAAELAKGDYRVILPASDAAIVALETPASDLVDKLSWPAAAHHAGLEVPETLVFDSGGALREAAASLTYPIVVKPAVKRFSARRFAVSREVERSTFGTGPLLVQPFLATDLHGIVGLAWHGRIVSAVHLRYLRIWPWPCGTVAAAVTVPPDIDLETRVAGLFGAYDGPFHCDFAGRSLLDVNPRIHATMPVAAAAGVPLLDLFCRLLGGEAPPRERARTGVTFRWVEGDVRSIVRGIRDGRMTLAHGIGAAAPRRGDVYGYESLQDPGPLRARFRFIGARLRNGPVAGPSEDEPQS